MHKAYDEAQQLSYEAARAYIMSQYLYNKFQHFLQNFQKGDCKIFRAEVCDARSSVGGKHLLAHYSELAVGLLRYLLRSHAICSSCLSHVD